ncbi:unnamed protein product [Phytophthora lilii]|uniref:Unnamed protein product n=1 Tax=Phytophthora lilii TaxID=2077276 RepID=A0A9W6XA31_9STRA|nr:unnamed protein product [Phytophthora lilii]
MAALSTTPPQTRILPFRRYLRFQSIRMETKERHVIKEKQVGEFRYLLSEATDTVRPITGQMTSSAQLATLDKVTAEDHRARKKNAGGGDFDGSCIWRYHRCRSQILK